MIFRKKKTKKGGVPIIPLYYTERKWKQLFMNFDHFFGSNHTYFSQTQIVEKLWARSPINSGLYIYPFCHVFVNFVSSFVSLSVSICYLLSFVFYHLYFSLYLLSFTFFQLHPGYGCNCECKKMFLTFETFSNIWFPILLALGLYCLLDGRNLHLLQS